MSAAAHSGPVADRDAFRREGLITRLMAAGYSLTDIAREMGVTRQAVQKMLAPG